MPRSVVLSRSTAGNAHMTTYTKDGLGLRDVKWRKVVGIAVCSVLAIWILIEATLFIQSIRARAEEQGTLLKIGFSPDWEYGGRKKLAHKLTNRAPGELEKVVAYMNDVYQPDIVVGGGDYVESSGVKPEKAKEQLLLINSIFSKLHAPRLYAIGNHDMRSLTKAEVLEILGLSEAHTIRDIGDWRLVVFDTNFDKNTDDDRGAKSYTVGYVSRSELEWLRRALETDRPTIVFSHHSPVTTLNIEGALSTNISNAEAVRAIFEHAPHVVAVVSGHTPRPQYQEYNGVHYFVGDTLVNETGLGAFATIDAYYNPFSKRAEIVFEHYGQNRQSYAAQEHIVDDMWANWWRMTREQWALKF